MMGKSSNIFKTGLLALGLTSLLLAPMAQADDDYNYYTYNRHNYNRHYDNRPYYIRHNYNRHNRYSGGYYRPHRSGHGGEVALGILTGGLLFYALTSNNRRNNHNNRTVYVQPQPVYVQPQPVYSPPAQPQNSFANVSCLQVREYQTTITVGNQTVPAYGQSCLQPDGSWRLGPAIPEPGN